MPAPTDRDVLVRFDARAGWWIETGFGPVGRSYPRLQEATLIARSYVRRPHGRVLVQTGVDWVEADPPVLLDPPSMPRGRPALTDSFT